MQVKIVLIEPEYSENLGLVARAIKNFGFKELVLVKPKTEHLNAGAKSRAMHALDVLKNAVITESFAKAIENCTYVIATSAKTTSAEKIPRTAITISEFAEKFGNSNAKLALVFGRESAGLNNEEIKQCDFLVTIPTHGKYKTLNLSHSVAIALYELSENKKTQRFNSAKTQTKKQLTEKFNTAIKNTKNIEKKESVKTSAKALISRALISEKEAKALVTFLSALEKQRNK